MTFSVAVRTVPQRRELLDGLLRHVIEWVKSGQVVEAYVNADADVSPNENACRALELASSSACDWILFLEDDAGPIHTFVPNVSWWLERHERPDVHVYPLGCQYARQWAPGAVFWDYPIEAFYCSVALAIRRVHVASLIAYLRANSHVLQGFDLMTGHWHKTISASRHLVTPVPCLVEHLGDESTLIDGRPDRNVVGRFEGFRGYDFSYVGVTGG